jgi:hypothetical protein
MHLRYSNHANLRMTQRGISKEQVELCLNNYQEKYPDENGNIQFAYHFIDGTLLRVVVKELSSEDWLVITVKN